MNIIAKKPGGSRKGFIGITEDNTLYLSESECDNNCEDCFSNSKDCIMYNYYMYD